MLPEVVTRRDLCVAGDLADAQMVVGEDLGATLRLRLVVDRERAPADERLLVAPGRQRQDPALRAATAETLIVDETFDPLDFRLQEPGEREILVPALGLRLDLEDHSEHRESPPWLAQRDGRRTAA